MASTKTKIKKNWLQTILVEGRQHLENPGSTLMSATAFCVPWSAGHPPWVAEYMRPKTRRRFSVTLASHLPALCAGIGLRSSGRENVGVLCRRSL